MTRPQIRPVAGAVPVLSCHFCTQPVAPCLAARCISFGFVHLQTRLHKCGNGLGQPTFAFAPGGAQ